MAAQEPLGRPMGVGELLDYAVRIYRRHFVTLVGIAAIAAILPLALQMVWTVLINSRMLFPSLGPSSNPMDFATASIAGLAVMGLWALVSGIAGILQTGALATAVGGAYSGGVPTLLQAYGQALRRWFPLLFAPLLVGLLNLLLLSAVFVPFFGVSIGGPALARNPAASAVVGLLVLVSCVALIPAVLLLILLNTHWLFVVQAIVLENLGIRAALGRSWRLVRGSFWRVLLTYAVLSLFIYLLSVGPVYVFQIGGLFIFPSSLLLLSIVNIVAQTVIGTFLAPLSAAILTLLYFDLRVRHEGLDLETRLKQLQAQSLQPQAEPSA